MNRKIEKVRKDIRRTQARLREFEEYLKTLQAKERQLEDEEIVSRIRGMQEKGSDILDVLKDIHTLRNDEDAGDVNGRIEKEEADEDDDDEI